MTTSVRGTLELVFHPNLEEYGTLSQTEEGRLARNRMLSILLDRLTYQEGGQTRPAKWSDPVEVEVVSGNLNPSVMMSKLAEKLLLMTGTLGSSLTVRNIASTPGLYYYFDDAGKKMCHDDWVIDGIAPPFTTSEVLPTSGQTVHLSGEVRIVFRREPLPA